MSNQKEVKVNPGDIVSGGFSYPNNATVEGDVLFLRDANGNQISGRTVADGDRITVLKLVTEKNLALVQYPTSSGVREGYVANQTYTIKYDNLERWVNGSTTEQVYETETSTTKIGSLSPNEKATVLFKKGSRYNLVYDTSAGVRTKSGFVDYAGGTGNGNSSSDIRPGDLVPGGFTYPNNAVIENDFLYLRDANGNQISGRTVSIGDKITVLDVSDSKQLALIQYPTSSGVRQGYVTNTTNIITYLNPYNWYNGSTAETVYLDSTGSNVFGTINPYEAATLLYKKSNRYHIVYDTSKGMLTKSGYVDFKGLDTPQSNITIPNISISGVEKIQYGTSGLGRALNAYKIGNGSKVLFAGFAIHGFEDNWFRDGEALVKIATELVSKFASYNQSNGLHGWSVYIAQCMNPDGVIQGVTNNGPGRCAVSTGIDLNRSFPTGFVVRTESRYKTGNAPLGAIEAVALKNFVSSLHSKASQMVVIDAHGWLNCTYGNSNIASYFTKQFGFSHQGVAGGGFFSRWAESLSNTSAILLEYPTSTRSYNDVINGNYIGKTYNAILNIIKNSPGSEGGNNDGGNDGSYDNNAEYHRSLSVTDPRMVGEDVKRVQNKLNALGYNAGNADGSYGYQTEGEVKKYQEAKGLWVDGIVGTSTWDSLMNQNSSNGNDGSYDNNAEYHRSLSVTDPRMVGEDVKRVQNKLNALGYNAGNADGSYGYQTEGEVKKYQEAKGLWVDGIVGSSTWNSLMNSDSLGGNTGNIKKVFIDPGHGGTDSGASDIVVEREVVLEISKRLGDILESKGISVKYSRTSNSTTVGLSERASMANSWGADVFLSIHANSASAAASGTETYIYTNPSETSKNLAGKIVNSISSDMQLSNRGVKNANFVVLREAAMPAVLVETAFVNNTSDANKLSGNPDGFARAIAKSILGSSVTGGDGSSNGGGGNSGNNNDYDNNENYHRVLRIATPFMQGADVKKVQNKLNALGYSVGNADGIFGYATENQVIAFQSSKGLSADGEVGTTTWNTLMNSSSSGESGNGDYDLNGSYHRVLRYQTPLMKGEDVKQVQGKLNSLGYNVGSVDGAYGYGTEAQVMKFQQAKGLSVDGAVGENTWNKLMGNQVIGKSHMEKVIGYLEELDTLAVEYCKTNEIENSTKFRNVCILDFLRQYHYNGFQWDATLGPLESRFIEYVVSKSKVHEKIYEYISKEHVHIQIPFKNYEIDLPHLAATTQGYYRSLAVPNFWTGWGGDLATAVADVRKKYENGDGTYDELAELIIGHNNYSFSEADIIADIDAIELAENLSSQTFYKIFKEYYNNVTAQKRKDTIIAKGIYVSTNTSEIKLADHISFMMFGPEGYKYLVVGGLLLLQKAGGSPTPIKATNACARAFAKYIFNKLK